MVDEFSVKPFPTNQKLALTDLNLPSRIATESLVRDWEYQYDCAQPSQSKRMESLIHPAKN